MGKEQEAPSEERWVAPLFLTLALLQLVPIWWFTYLPTADGPTHVYNSWIVRQLVLGRDDVLARTYRIDWRPYPNWLGHAAMAALLGIFPPTVTEKIFFSAIVVLFLAAAWKYAGLGGWGARANAFLALPFTFHQMLQLGFYNFSLSVGLCFLAIAVWWERRDDPRWKSIALIALIIFVCYWSHPMSTLLAIGSIGLLWLLTLRGRSVGRHARHLVALLPVIPLLIWFVMQSGAAGHGRQSLRELGRFLFEMRLLLTFDARQLVFGRLLCCLIVLLFVATLVMERRRREVDAFLALTLAFVALFILSPDNMAGGFGVKERMSLFVVLAPLPWISTGGRRWLRRSLVVVMSLVAVANAMFVFRQYRRYERPLASLAGVAARAEPHSTILPLLFTRQPSFTYIPVFSGTVAYAAAEKSLIDLDNYEALTGHFPVQYQPGAFVPPIVTIQARPWEVDVDSLAPHAEYVVIWDVPPSLNLRDRLATHYRLVFKADGAELYRLKDAPRSTATSACRLTHPHTR